MHFININKLNLSTLPLLSLFLAAVFSALSFAPAPKGNYNLISSVPVNARFLTTDYLKSAYVINNKNQVIKYDSTGTILGVFSEERYGSLTSVDATSPFNVLLFYKDFSTIITTDMRLNAKRLYKLSTLGMNNVAAACLSNDNYIWVYDMNDGKLKKIDQNYQVIQQSLSLPQLFGEAVEPNFLVESGGLVYMNVPDMGVITFDVFGTFYTAISNSDFGTPRTETFQVIDHKIVYFYDGNLFIYDVASGMPDSVPVPKTTNTNNVRVEKGRLYLLNEKTLDFYSQTK
ncbi:hypothetical protein C7N43_18705 [Sphingobacteriales bacterium UPWRP_1]|nr:hypothetical protein C7N43_18705 [Sphingobacteriales bacterium UPWRP_1]